MASALLDRLRPRLAPGLDGRLLLTPELLAAPRIGALWLVLLGDDELPLVDAEISAQDARGAFRITGRADFLGLENVPVEIWLFTSSDPAGVVDEQLECIILPSGLDHSWDLESVFDPPARLERWSDDPEPLPSALEGLSFAKPRFAYSSFDFLWGVSAEGFEMTPALAPPDWGGPALQAGINLTGRIAADGPAWAEMKAIRPSLADLDVEGVIRAADDGPRLRLAHRFGEDATLSLTGAGALSLRLVELAVESGLDGTGSEPAVGLTVELKAGDTVLELDLDFNLGRVAADLTGDFGDHPITLDQVEAALGLTGLAGMMPAGSLGGLGLARLEAELSLAPPRIDRLSFTISTAEPWNVLPGYVSVEPRFTFEFVSSGGETVRTIEAEADWDLDGTHFDTVLSPGTGQMAAYMAAGESLNAGAVIARFLPGVERPDCQLIDLDLHGNFLEGSFGFEIETHGEWTFDLGHDIDVSIGDIGLSGAYDESGITGRMSGTVSVAGWAAKLDIVLERQLSIQVDLPEVNVSELAETFLKLVHMPVDLPDFEIDNLDVQMIPSIGEFHISGDSPDRIHLFPGFDVQVSHFAVSRSRIDGPATEPAKQIRAELHIELGFGPPDRRTALTAVAGYTAVEGGAAPSAEWAFEAALENQAIPLGDLLAALEHLSGLDYPLPTEGLEIRHLHLAFNLGGTAARCFAFSCTLGRGDSDYGAFSIVALKQAPAALAADDAAIAPVAEADGKGGWSYALTLQAEMDIGLADLPMIGRPLDEVARMRLRTLQLTMASRDHSAEEVSAFRNHLSRDAPRPPDAPLKEGANLSIQASFPGETVLFPAMLGGDAPAAPSFDPAAAPAAAGPERAPVNRRSTGMTRWLPLHKSAGPVRLERLGLRFQDGTLTILFDAGLSLQGLKLGLAGLGLGSPVNRFDPVFSIEGVSIEYQGGPVSVGGGLMATPDGAFEGLVRMSLEGFGLTAIGEYIRLPGGRTSLFVFGVIDAPIGGPPYCFVRGVAAGLGFNSALRIPDAETVGDFSLVRAAQGAEGFGSPGLVEILAAMGTDVRPRTGSEWLAAGIRFTSFEIVSSVALLTVALDSGAPRIGLVGLSRASVPPMSADPIAYVELGLVAQMDPGAGLLAVEGQVTRSSFILSSACRPTGGFAFYSWFAGPHAGDFVMTVGGFHPRFEVPAHYPRVPRMQILWRLSGNLQLKGTSYFALIPNAVMAGGSIEVVWQAGDLRAWFNADYDFLIYWKPFRYVVDISISVGASVRIRLLFVSFTLTIHVGAKLHLRGPPFGGEAWVDLSVVSFSIPFGDSAPRAPLLSWPEFKQAFLPAPGGCRGLQRPRGDADGVAAVPTRTICSLRIVGGLTRELTDEPGYAGPPRYLVDPERFAASSSSLIPSKTARLNGAAVDGGWSTDFGVGPMGAAEGAVHSTHHVRFEARVGHDAWTSCPIGIVPTIGAVPAALWLGADGAPPANAAGPDLGGRRLVDGTLTGFSLRPAAIEPDVSRPAGLDELLFETVPDKVFDWAEPPRTGRATPPPSAAQPPDPPGRLTVGSLQGPAIVNEDYVLKALIDPAIAGRRAAVIDSLAARCGRSYGQVDLAGMGSRIALTDWPRLGALGRAT